MKRAVIVTGSRHIREDGPWSEFIWNKIAGLRFGTTPIDRPDIVVIHGDCRGADRMAARAAASLGNGEGK